MKQTKLALLACAAGLGVLACNPPNVAGPALTPVTTKDAFKSQVQCNAIRPKTEPDLMAWDPGERANLNESRQQGLVVVRYKAKGCDVELQVLSNCAAPGSYTYYPYSSSSSIVVNNLTELYGKLPLGASRFAAKVHGDRALRTDYKLVGIDAIPVGTVVRRNELRGDCKGATHVISKIYLGGFAIDAGEKRKIDTAATVFGAGVGATTAAGVQQVQSEGNPAACAEAMNQGTPEVGCSAPLRIALLPISAPVHQCPAGSQWTGSGCEASEVSCPSGTQWNGSECVARVDKNCTDGMHFVSGEGCVPDTGAPTNVATEQPATQPDVSNETHSSWANQSPEADTGERPGKSFWWKAKHGVGPANFDLGFLSLGPFTGKLPGSFSFAKDSLHGEGAYFDSKAGIYGANFRGNMTLFNYLFAGGSAVYGRTGSIRAKRVATYSPFDSNPTLTELGPQDFDINNLDFGFQAGARLPLDFVALGAGVGGGLSVWWLSAKDSTVSKTLSDHDQNWTGEIGGYGEAFVQATVAPVCHFAVMVTGGQRWSQIDYPFVGAALAYTDYESSWDRCPSSR